MSFMCKGLTFLSFCVQFVAELSTFLLVIISPNNFANTNTTCTNRFIYISNNGGYFESKALLFFCMDTATIFKVMLYCWKNKLLSETKRKFITLGFEDFTSRTFEVIRMMSSKKCQGIQQPSRRFEACRLIRRYKINHINTPFCRIIKRKNMRFLLLICPNTDSC